MLAVAKFKNLARDCIPLRFQVPIKYFYNKITGKLESEMDILSCLVRENDRVIDIGGNRGIYAYEFWNLGLKVEVFEPNATCASVLSAWAADKTDVNVYPVALSNQNGDSQLHIPIDEAGVEHDASGSLEIENVINSRDQAVELVKLDVYRFKDVKMIKIDVEGHETKVIEGAEETIKTHKPVLLVEIEQRHNDQPISEVINKILDFGYDGYFLEEEKLIPIGRFDASKDQILQNLGSSYERYINNFIFLHRLTSFYIEGLLSEG